MQLGDPRCDVEACCGHPVHPDGDSPITDSALNDFVFFVPFVVQLPDFGSSTIRAMDTVACLPWVSRTLCFSTSRGPPILPAASSAAASLTEGVPV